MKIIFEQSDGIEYFEIQLTEKEIKDILSYKGIEENVMVKRRQTSVYVRRTSDTQINK